ncbi:MAG: hypothetical protein ABSF61_14240 [Anaerolineales bacterium]|jgi:septal ring factor EnvC (AmiA/AmiB activator)
MILSHEEGTIKNAILIVAVLALLASLAGNGILALGNADKAKALVGWQGRTTSLTSQLDQVTGERDQARAGLANARQTIATLTKDNSDKDASIASLKSQRTENQTFSSGL